MSSQQQRSLSRSFLRASLLLIPLSVLVLMLWRPVLVAESSAPHVARQTSESFVQKVGELESAHLRGEKAEIRFTAEEVNAALDQPVQLKFSGDRMTGQLVSEIQGQKIYLTLGGRLGTNDGYVTFQPDEVRIGNMPLPASLLNGPLQKKLREPAIRERLKLPEYISDLRIENGQLVIEER